MREEAAAQREREIAAAKAAIEAETRQAIDQIKNEVADLTLLATEKVVGRALDEAEGRRLVEEALAEVDFSALGSGVARWRRQPAGRVYGTALAEAAQAAGRLHEVARDLAAIARRGRREPRARAACSSTRPSRTPPRSRSSRR